MNDWRGSINKEISKKETDVNKLVKKEKNLKPIIRKFVKGFDNSIKFH